MVVCFNFSKTSINILSLLICFICFYSTKFLLNAISNKFEDIWTTDISYEVQADTVVLPKDEIEKDDINIENLEKEKLFDWALKIPKINLYAEIFEGTDPDILNQYIGHFTESKAESGNVCLAAHNRGYNVNYFSDLNTLEIGDEIYYYINNKEYKYEIFEILVIHETDWSVIQNTEEDIITLITCIENREAYRLCVQGIKVE